MKLTKKISALVVICMLASLLLSSCQTKLPDYVDVYVTTGTMSKLLSRQTSLQFREYGEEEEMDGISIVVDRDKKYQEFYGYGAALTHSSAYLLTEEGAEATADEMLRELYGEDGARLSIVRIPIGASDYIEGSSFFTCCDTLGNVDDMELENFSIERDVNLIKVLKKIIAINPDVKIFAAPWSAPAWMKDSKSLTADGTLEEEYYEVYADYLVKFIEAYKAEGIDIDYLSLVNEPLIRNCGYPHMDINEEQAVQIGEMLTSRLSAKKLSTELLAWEHNVDEMAYDYLSTVLDGDSAKNFAGVAFHGYADVNEGTINDGADYVRETYSKKLVFMTEITEHSGSNDFASNLSYAARYTTLDPINHGVSGSMFWNLALRSDGSPTPVKHGNECYGVMDIDVKDGEFTYYKRSAYYAMAQISKFAYAIDGEYPVALGVTSSNDAQILATALYRADGAIIVSAVNISDQLSETVHLVIDGQCVSFELMPQSIVTFIV